MSDGFGPAGIRADTTVAVEDWRELGHWFARQSSDSQTRFLIGMAEGLWTLNGSSELSPSLARGMQIAYVSSELKRRGVSYDLVVSMLDDLLGMLREPGS